MIGRLASAQRAAAVAQIRTTADLVALTPSKATPPRRIIPAENLAVLRADYRAAQAATGVGWSYLAAINYYSPVIHRLPRGWVLLPPGYGINPATRAIPLQLLPAPYLGRQPEHANLRGP